MATYSLAGKTVLITGAARGIGAETARQAAAKGANVALLDVNTEGLEQTSAAIATSAWFECDVTDPGAIERATAGTVERFGGIDVVVANAGIGIQGTLEGLPLAAIERTIDINLLGVIRTVKAALPHLLERRGYVVVVASSAAFMHTTPLVHYAAAKAGAEAFGNGLRTELIGRGVDVGVAYFGFIDTEMVAAAKSDPVIAKFEGRARSPKWFEKTYPVSDAGRAIVRGIEGRKRRIMWPPQGFRLLYARVLLPRIIERNIAKADGRAFVAEMTAAGQREGAEASLEAVKPDL